VASGPAPPRLSVARSQRAPSYAHGDRTGFRLRVAIRSCADRFEWNRHKLHRRKVISLHYPERSDCTRIPPPAVRDPIQTFVTGSFRATKSRNLPITLFQSRHMHQAGLQIAAENRTCHYSPPDGLMAKFIRHCRANPPNIIRVSKPTNRKALKAGVCDGGTRGYRKYEARPHSSVSCHLCETAI
jgi:hypothetical protein